ncbi:MAG: Stp1/IreP family PP2C-type Ser/Thr phosphatase [Solobacterium sp.]|nr:Stp1/IreP family PP2C-type Ser/Thr phosphatase [Solobacterium sp.]
MKYYGITDKGIKRANNQDNYVIATNLSGEVFAIVCDGIGGAKGGDIASGIAVTELSVAFSQTYAFTEYRNMKAWINHRIGEVNRKIKETGRENEELAGMGTTLTGALITHAGTFVINIGDSRTYSYTNSGHLHQLTRDHTLINDMLLHGEITVSQAENSTNKNVLSNALGVWDTVRCDIELHTEPFDGLLLCSDGLHGYVDHEVMEQIVTDHQNDPSLRTRRLLQEALKAGGFDNITIVIVDLERENA